MQYQRNNNHRTLLHCSLQLMTHAAAKLVIRFVTTGCAINQAAW